VEVDKELAKMVVRGKEEEEFFVGLVRRVLYYTGSGPAPACYRTAIVL